MSLHLTAFMGFHSLNVSDCFLNPHTFFASATFFGKLYFTPVLMP